MAIIYRYTDLYDNKIKYIGIIWSDNSTLEQRVYHHSLNDEWCKKGTWKIEYLKKPIKTRTDAEYLEAHYINKFNTNKYNNVKKSNWGKGSLIDDMDDEWLPYNIIGDDSLSDLIQYSDELKFFRTFTERGWVLREKIFENEVKLEKLRIEVNNISEELNRLYAMKKDIEFQELQQIELLQVLTDSFKTKSEILAFLRQ